MLLCGCTCTMCWLDVRVLHDFGLIRVLHVCSGRGLPSHFVLFFSSFIDSHPQPCNRQCIELHLCWGKGLCCRCIASCRRVAACSIARLWLAAPSPLPHASAASYCGASANGGAVHGRLCGMPQWYSGRPAPACVTNAARGHTDTLPPRPRSVAIDHCERQGIGPHTGEPWR
jgi:hypothetical protein